MEIILQKQCSKCRGIKPVEEFSHNKNRPSGLRTCCKICDAEVYKKYHKAHTTERHEHNREWQIKYPEYQKEYQIAHPDKIAEWTERRRALKANARGDGVTARQWRNMQEDYNYLCAYCNQKKPLAMDHIVPLSKGGKHDIENMVPACKSCNSSKNDTSLLIFLYRNMSP